MCPPRRPGFAVFCILILSVLIFYQLILTLFLPFRFNVFILIVEICLLFFFLFKIVWPY